MSKVGRNIVETRKLASRGRFGDNMVREIDEAPAHVNAYEAYLIDSLGNTGENIVKDIGAGSINPDTGMKEYHWVLKDPLNMHHNRQIYGDRAVDMLYGEGGAMGELPPDPKSLIQQAGQITNVGMEGLLKQQEQYMGPGGFLTREQRLEEEGIGAGYQQSMKRITSERDKLILGTNLAYSGEIEQRIGDVKDVAKDKYTSQMELSGLKAEKAEVDFMANLRKQMNQFISDYQSTAGEPYAGGPAMTELNKVFSNYYAEDEGGNV